MTSIRANPEQTEHEPRSESLGEEKAEARVLSKHILDSVSLSDQGSRDFVYYRFELPLVWYGQRAPKLRRRHTQVALAVIAGGLLSSGLTAVAKGQGAAFSELVGWVVIGLGLVVGLGTGLMQISKLSQKSVAYGNAQGELRREGWDLVNRRGRYATGDGPERFAAFVDVVLDLETRTRAIDKDDSPQAGS